MQLEDIILENLLHHEEYARRVLPYLKEEYFHNIGHQTVFSQIREYIGKYNKPPTQEELIIEIQNQKGITQGAYQESIDIVRSLTRKNKTSGLDWLVENTETFCKDKALYNAIVGAASMIEDKSNVGQIPDLLKDALSVSFDNNIGHDFKEQIAERYKTLHETHEYKIPFDIPVLNEITSGGLPRKTLNVIAASTGAGKSLFLCHCAARNFLAGLNVLYISMEMAEERISERIDANIIEMNIGDLKTISLQDYKKRLMKRIGDKPGRLIVKEYPTASAGASQFRALLNELRLKKDFQPDIIYLDYLNICASSRFKAAAVNSYQYVKAIAEEIRGLAIEYNVPIVSATQLNRSGTDASDVSLGEISDCLDMNTKILTRKGEKKISELKVGDEISNAFGFTQILKVHHSKVKRAFRIRTKSGKEIICSAEHQFPTADGRKSISSGLSVGDLLSTQ